MKRNLLKFLPFLIGAALILSSCGGDSDDEEEKPADETAPVIETPAVPTEGQVFGLSGYVKYEGDFTDDVALKQVVFSLSSLKGVEDPVWTPAAVTIELEGKEASIDQNIFESIPGDVYNGPEGYELKIECEDEAGNKSSKKIKILLE